MKKVGEQLKWQKDKWSILIERTFVVKAQEVYFALSIEERLVSIMTNSKGTYSRLMISQCQKPIDKKFQKHRKAYEQTYVELAYQKEKYFNR